MTVILEEFETLNKHVTKDKRGRVTLGPEVTDEEFIVSRNAVGQIFLTPVASVPKHELWLWNNPVLRSRPCSAVCFRPPMARRIRQTSRTTLILRSKTDALRSSHYARSSGDHRPAGGNRSREAPEGTEDIGADANQSAPSRSAHTRI